MCSVIPLRSCLNYKMKLFAVRWDLCGNFILNENTFPPSPGNPQPSFEFMATLVLPKACVVPHAIYGKAALQRE